MMGYYTFHWPKWWGTSPPTKPIMGHYSFHRQRQCDALSNFLLGILGSCRSCGCYFDTDCLPKHCCNGIPWHSSGPFQQDNASHSHHTFKIWFNIVLKDTMSLRCWLGLQIPTEHLWGRAWKPCVIHGGPTSQLARPKGSDTEGQNLQCAQVYWAILFMEGAAITSRLIAVHRN